jgi:predicted amidohydrolase
VSTTTKHLTTAFRLFQMMATLSARFRILTPAAVPLLAMCLAGLTPISRGATSTEAPRPGEPLDVARRDRLPRKILVGTEIAGYDLIEKFSLEQRFRRMDEYVDAMEAQARGKYPGKGLDLVLLGEYFMAKGQEKLADNAVRLDEVLPRIATCAKHHGCYIVAPLVLREDGPVERYSNAAVLVGRDGKVVGIYRKVHLTTDLKYVLLEGGMTPGTNFPVFDCDFGRVGIQICFDMTFPDGWEALDKQGAELVLMPTETPQTIRPSMYALLHRYYIVSATPRNHAAVYNPIGMIEEEITQEGVLVHQIDLSYAIAGWDPGWDNGVALKRMFGDKVGYTYYFGEDCGIYWSNDPKTSIGQFLRPLGFPEPRDDFVLERQLEEKVRGGPPQLP